MGRSPFMQDKHTDDILAATKSFLQSAVLHPNLSVHLKTSLSFGASPQPILQLMQDPDMGLIDMAEPGFHTGVFEPTRFSGIWRRQATEARQGLPLGINDTNSKSAEEDPVSMSRPCPRTAQGA